MDSPPVGLANQPVRCRRQDISAFLTVVLNGIHQGLRVFNAHAHRKRLRFQRPTLRIEQLKNIAGAVPRGEDQVFRGAPVAFSRGHVFPGYCIQHTVDGLHVNQPRAEMHLATSRANGLTHALDDLRQFVRPNVRMGVHQNRWVRTEVDQPLQSTADVAALVASRIQFAIAVSACSAFSKTVIRIGIYGVVAGDFHKVPPALAHGLAAFQNDGTSALADERECRKQSGRSGTYDVDRFRVVCEGIQLRVEGTRLRQAITRWSHLKSPNRLNRPFARVEVFPHHAVFAEL